MAGTTKNRELRASRQNKRRITKIRNYVMSYFDFIFSITFQTSLNTSKTVLPASKLGLITVKTCSLWLAVKRKNSVQTLVIKFLFTKFSVTKSQTFFPKIVPEGD